MENDKGEVLVRERVGETPAVPAESVRKSPASWGSSFASEQQLERRRLELQTALERDKAAGEALLARLDRRSEALREFLLEAEKNLEKLEELKLVIHAEKEFLTRIGQLELRCARAAGRCPELRGGEAAGEKRQEEGTPVPQTMGGMFQQSLPMIFGMIVGALIIAGAMALIFL